MYHKGGRDCALLYFISKIAKNCYPQKCPSKNMSEIFHFRHKIAHTEKQNQKTRKVTYDKYTLFD